jgi:HSP20 family molecular chaperone IbpA
MPGVAPDDVDVTLERQVLTLRGKVRPTAPEGYRRLSSEYRVGDYIRVFTLSDEIDQTKINASFQNGVLRLELPRSAESKPMKITVKAA